MSTPHDTWQWQDPGTAWKGAGLYHITLTIPSREALLGTLLIPDNDPTQAKVEATTLGRAVLGCLRQVPIRHPEIQVLHYCLMPDHIHAVWYVRTRMQKGIMTAVRGFWQGVKKAGREIYGVSPLAFVPASPLSSITPNTIRQNSQESSIRQTFQEKIFTEMPFVHPMGQRRQLPATIRYIDMNPQRLATKRLKPGFLRVQEGIEIAGRQYSGVGNIALLQAERLVPVHVRSMWVRDAEQHGYYQPLRDYMNGCVLQARQGTVMVSPFISRQEKQVLEVLLKEKRPVIYIAANGFRDYYKPADGLFDAVAEGRMLILSPWEYDAQKHHVSREECILMNHMAEEITAAL